MADSIRMDVHGIMVESLPRCPLPFRLFRRCDCRTSLLLYWRRSGKGGADELFDLFHLTVSIEDMELRSYDWFLL